jgi:hypothetical protein
MTGDATSSANRNTKSFFTDWQFYRKFRSSAGCSLTTLRQKIPACGACVHARAVKCVSFEAFPSESLLALLLFRCAR